MDLTTIGSFVAFGLAALRVTEFTRDRRPRLYLQTVLRGSAEIGNDLLLLNSSRVPANIYYYELVWTKPGILRRLFRRREIIRHEFSLEDDTCDITVDGYSLVKLNFSDQDHFDWGDDVTKDLYLKILLVGRKRPLWFQVT